MPGSWAEAIDRLPDGGHLGVLHSRASTLTQVAERFLRVGVDRSLLPVIVARADEAKFWIERALPDPSDVRGGEFGLRFVPVPPRLAPAGLLPILESVSEAAVYAEDLGLRGVCIVSVLAWGVLQLGNEPLALQAESAIEELPFLHSLLCACPRGAEEGGAAQVFRRLHPRLILDTKMGIDLDERVPVAP